MEALKSNLEQNVIRTKGSIQPDGSLTLEHPLPLAPGPVEVVVQPMQSSAEKSGILSLLQSIWSGQKSRGHIPRTPNEIEADRIELLKDWDKRQMEIERNQLEARILRGASSI